MDQLEVLDYVNEKYYNNVPTYNPYMYLKGYSPTEIYKANKKESNELAVESYLSRQPLSSIDYSNIRINIKSEVKP